MTDTNRRTFLAGAALTGAAVTLAGSNTPARAQAAGSGSTAPT